MTLAQPVVVRLDTVDYMLGPSYDFPTGLVDRIDSSTVLDHPFPVPVTVLVRGDVTDIRQSWLIEQFEDISRRDDVWCKSFAENVILQTDTHKIFARLKDETFEGVSNGPQQERGTRIPEGPYFLQNSKLYQAFRLFPDPLGAFVCGVIPDAAANQLSRGGTEAAW